MGSQTVQYTVTGSGTGFNKRPATVEIKFVVELDETERFETVPLPSMLTDSITESAKIWGINGFQVTNAEYTILAKTETKPVTAASL